MSMKTDNVIVELAQQLKENGKYQNANSVDEVVRAVLTERVTEVEENAQAAQEKREELRDRMGIDDGSNGSDGSQTAAEAKQAELRDRMGR